MIHTLQYCCFSSIQNRIKFEDEKMNAELFINFGSYILTCNTFVDQNSLEQEICSILKNEKRVKKTVFVKIKLI